MIPVTYQTPAAILLILGGLVSCFAGYRFFRIVLVLYGLVLGALIATTLVGAGSTTQLVAAALLGGLVGAFVLYAAYFVGVALVGAAVTTLLAHIIWTEVGREPHVFAVIFFAVCGAAAAMLLQRHVIVAATAVGGAWTMVIGGLALAGGDGPLEAASGGDVWIVYPFSARPEDRWVIVLWLALSAVGVLMQLGWTGGRKRRKKS
jgi:hypothetical protein